MQTILLVLILLLILIDIKEGIRIRQLEKKTFALQPICITQIKADFIVIRNIKDFINSKIPAIKPSELL